MARELQARAAEYLAKLDAEAWMPSGWSSGSRTRSARFSASPSAMLVELGENGIKTVEDLADCATDDLAGWSERKDGETTKHAGILDELSREEAEALIMQARVKMGWTQGGGSGGAGGRAVSEAGEVEAEA